MSVFLGGWDASWLNYIWFSCLCWEDPIGWWVPCLRIVELTSVENRGAIGFWDMKNCKIYSKKFKETWVEKMLNRGDRTIISICEEAGVLLGTGAKWISEAQVKTDRSNRKSSRISVQAQIKAVNDTTNLKDEEWGLYLRREGLYSTQIEEWRTLMENALPWNKKPVKDARDTKIKQLEHEILRKGLSWTISVACSQKKGIFFEKKKEED